MSNQSNPAVHAAAWILTVFLFSALGLALIILAVTHPGAFVLSVVVPLILARIVQRLRRK